MDVHPELVVVGLEPADQHLPQKPVSLSCLESQLSEPLAVMSEPLAMKYAPWSAQALIPFDLHGMALIESLDLG